MSVCPICSRVYCDHTDTERGQTAKETVRPLTPSEEALWRSGALVTTRITSFQAAVEKTASRRGRR